MTPSDALAFLRQWSHIHEECAEVAGVIRKLAADVRAAQRETARYRRRESEAQRQRRVIARRTHRLAQAGKTRCHPNN